MLSVLSIGAGIILAAIAAVLTFLGVVMISHALKSGDGGMGEFGLGIIVCVVAAMFATGAYFAAF